MTNTPINPRSIAVLIKDKKVLMWWRYTNGIEHHGFPGGTVEDGETTEGALVREVYEELNLRVRTFQKFYEWVHEYNIEDKHFAREETYFFITEFEGEIKLGAPELFRQNKENIYRPDWLDYDQLSKLDYSPKEVIDLILERIA